MVSKFAGQYDAAAFAYGLVGSGAPQALMVNVGNPAAGTVALQLEYGYTVTEDGILFSPLNTNAPVIFGSGANAETLTPSAVSNGTPTIYGSPTVTAAFANTHGQGDTLSSGTYGLQEALNYAASVGGGTVVLSPRWATLGGTSAILAAATIPTTVTVQDARSGGGVTTNYTTVAIANAAVKTLNATPVSIVPAQGAGTLVEVISAVFENLYTTAAFAAGSALGLVYGAAGVAAAPTVAATFLTSPAANQTIMVAGAIATQLSSAVLNTAVVLQAASTEFTTGGGSLTVRCSYRVHRGM